MLPVEVPARIWKIPAALASKYAKNNAELWEELESCGNEAVARAAYSYRPNDCSKMSTYFFAVVKYKMWETIKRLRRREEHEVNLRNTIVGGKFNYDGFRTEVAPSIIDPRQRDPAETVATKDELETILSHLPENRRKEVEDVANGCSSRMLAEKSGVAPHTFRQRLCRAKEKAIGKVYPMFVHFKVGSRVRLITPENARLNNMTATVEALEEWGAHVSCDAAATRKFRALWEEMQPIEFLNGEAARMTNAEIETVIDVSEKVLSDGESREKGLAGGGARDLGYTGDACDLCGSFLMRRVGKCLYCEGCNTSAGCS